LKKVGEIEMHLKQTISLEVGRALAEAALFHLFSKAQAQEWHKPNLFSNVFKPAET
jgi:hypothetical protein